MLLSLSLWVVFVVSNSSSLTLFFQISAYETNLVHLIKDLRREWNKPNLPISIGISGFEGWKHQGTGRTPPDCWDGPNATKINCQCPGDDDRECRRIDIMLSQIGAANLTRHPELGCCVEAVETRDFWRDEQYSPSNQGYHFNWNAETHYRIGKAMAEGINRASATQQQKEEKEAASAASAALVSSIVNYNKEEVVVMSKEES